VGAPVLSTDLAGAPPPNANAGVGAVFSVAVGAAAGALEPNIPNGGAPAGAGVGAVFSAAVGAAAGALEPNIPNGGAPAGAGVVPLPAGTDSDGVPVPKENVVFFLLGGSEDEVSSFFSWDAMVVLLEDGGAPKENPGMDAPPPAPPFFSAVPNENPPPLAGTGSSFFSSLPPKEKSDLFAGAGAAGAAAPNWNPPPDGGARPAVDPEASSSRSRFDFDLAGVFAGEAAGIENPTPPLPPFDAAPPKLNPPAPMLGLSPSASSRSRFALAGVAPPNVTLLLLLPPLSFSLEASLDPKVNPPPPGVVGGAGAGAEDVGAPNENPPVPMLAFALLTALLLALSLELPSFGASSAPGFGVSHARHFKASFGFFVLHTSHFHSPGFGLKRSPHPEVAGGAAAELAGGVESFLGKYFDTRELGVFSTGDDEVASVGLVPNLYDGVSTFDDAATPPGMKSNGAPDPPIVAFAATISSALLNNAGVDTAEAATPAAAPPFLGWGVPLLLSLAFRGSRTAASPNP